MFSFACWSISSKDPHGDFESCLNFRSSLATMCIGPITSVLFCVLLVFWPFPCNTIVWSILHRLPTSSLGNLSRMLEVKSSTLLIDSLFVEIDDPLQRSLCLNIVEEAYMPLHSVLIDVLFFFNLRPDFVALISG